MHIIKEHKIRFKNTIMSEANLMTVEPEGRQASVASDRLVLILL